MKVAAVVLAAGGSERLGQRKQLVQVGGERLLERAVRTTVEAGCEPVIVVLGAYAAEIACACSLAPAQVMVNCEWSEGMASSVRAGVMAIPEDVDGLLLLTCDQPAVTSDHLRQLVEAAVAAGGNGAVCAVGSSYGGRIGVPAFFPVARFHELRALRGDGGARLLLEAGRAVELPGGELDVDTVDALEEVRLRYGGD